MKEAAGEANLTVVAIILIAVVVAVATPLISNLMRSTSRRACCTDAGGRWSGNSCTAFTGAAARNYNASAYNSCITAANGN